MNKLSSNIFLKLVVFVLVICTLIGAAQLFLPDQYKPYNLVFKPNYNLPLAKDNLFSLSKIKQCNLDVQYPSKLNSKKLELYELYKTTSQQDDKDFVGSFAITNNQDNENQDSRINPAVITCAKSLNSLGQLPTKEITGAKFYRLTGLFVGYNPSVTDFRTDSESDFGIQKFSFKRGEFYYTISADVQKLNDTDNFEKGIIANQIEIQFSDFVVSNDSEESKLIPIVKQPKPQ